MFKKWVGPYLLFPCKQKWPSTLLYAHIVLVHINYIYRFCFNFLIASKRKKSLACSCAGYTVTGSMYSVKLLTESTVKGAVIPLYNYVYNCTLETVPSAFFLISVAMTAPLVVIFGQVFSLINHLLRLDCIHIGTVSDEPSLFRVLRRLVTFTR